MASAFMFIFRYERVCFRSSLIYYREVQNDQLHDGSIGRVPSGGTKSCLHGGGSHLMQRT